MKKEAQLSALCFLSSWCDATTIFCHDQWDFESLYQNNYPYSCVIILAVVIPTIFPSKLESKERIMVYETFRVWGDTSNFIAIVEKQNFVGFN